LRGPTAEGRFADQVHHFKAFSEPWRFSLSLHDEVYGIAEGLLNLWRRLRRGEELPFTDEEAMQSAFLMYRPTQLDDLLVTKNKVSPTLSPFTFVGEEEIPCSLVGIISSPERFREILEGSPHQTSLKKRERNDGEERRGNKRLKGKEKTKEKEKEIEEERNQFEYDEEAELREASKAMTRFAKRTHTPKAPALRKN
jgi:hypothetical protein